MSRAATQRTVKFISKMGTYTCYLQSNSGRVWQMYDDGGNISPDFTKEPCIIYFVVISSRVSGSSRPSAVINGIPKWHLGGTLLNNGSVPAQSGWNGYFELISPSESQPYYGIKFTKNLVEGAGGSSITLKAEAEVTIDGTEATDTLQAQMSIDIFPVQNTGVMVVVFDKSNKNFTFTEENETITLEAKAYKGASEITDLLKYQWQRIVSGDWSSSGISTPTSKTTEVHENDVMTYAQYRCGVTIDGSTYYGYANIMDATDPYIIEPCPQRRRGGVVTDSVEEIENEGDEVYYEPKIVLRNGEGTEATDVEKIFNFTYVGSAGEKIYHLAEKSTSESYPVNYDMCRSHGNIAVNIETSRDLNDYDE